LKQKLDEKIKELNLPAATNVCKDGHIFKCVTVVRLIEGELTLLREKNCDKCGDATFISASRSEEEFYDPFISDSRSAKEFYDL
jgi:hypothetical protein